MARMPEFWLVEVDTRRIDEIKELLERLIAVGERIIEEIIDNEKEEKERG